MDFISDFSTEASTNADVGGVNIGVTINDSTLAKEPINTNEETVGNTNVGIDTSMEKDKYIWPVVWDDWNWVSIAESFLFSSASNQRIFMTCFPVETLTSASIRVSILTCENLY